MKVVFSKTACDLLGRGIPPQQAAEQALRLLERKTGNSQAGIVLMCRSGEVGSAFDAHHMVQVCLRDDGEMWIQD